MRVIGLVLLIAVLAVQGNVPTCEESKALELTCGGYCFNVVKSLLDHSKAMQSELRYCNPNSESNIDALIEQKFKTLEAKVEKRLKDLPIKLPADIYPYEQIGSKFYLIEEGLYLNWSQANRLCLLTSGHLVHLQNRSELNAIIPRLSNNDYWLDINNILKEDDYVSKTSGKAPPFFAWFPNEPNKGQERCVELHNKFSVYAMSDAKCDSSYFNIICEKEFQD
ncbi:C-type lectin domain family 6 member A-like [Drosophila nasuta]|uniref:C-type lectin domain family 6 member A-like n=1 Tax=Drosophila nasuta TaxID=42062 RepID=UPI00295E9166|nr:C-type lectin domain family 6 member A-like [Drosophila nasuta]